MISPGIHISLNKYRSLNGSAFIRLVPHHRKENQQHSDRLNIQKRYKIHFYKLTINIMRQLSFHLPRQLGRNVLLLHWWLRQDKCHHLPSAFQLSLATIILGPIISPIAMMVALAVDEEERPQQVTAATIIGRQRNTYRVLLLHHAAWFMRVKWK